MDQIVHDQTQQYCTVGLHIKKQTFSLVLVPLKMYTYIHIHVCEQSKMVPELEWQL